MPLNVNLKTKGYIADREARFARRMKHLCKPRQDEHYNVVSKFDGSVIEKNITMEDFTKYGTAMLGYALQPVN